MIATIEGSVELLRLSSIDEHEAMKVVPKMRSEEWPAFLADIQRRGIQEPIVVCQWRKRYILLDGRHRLEAARLCEYETIPARVIDVAEDQQPDWIIRAALIRRHLDASQRAALAARLVTTSGKGRPKQNAENSVITQERAADLFNVSVDSVQQAQKVIANGSAQLIAAVDAGELPVSVAAKVADLPKKEQAAVLAGNREQVRPAIERVAFSRALYDELSRIRKNISGIRERFGSVAEMLKAPGWDKADTRDVLEMSGMMAAELTDLNKELQKHVKSKNQKSA